MAPPPPTAIITCYSVLLLWSVFLFCVGRQQKQHHFVDGAAAAATTRGASARGFFYSSTSLCHHYHHAFIIEQRRRHHPTKSPCDNKRVLKQKGWVESNDGEWEWEEDSNDSTAAAAAAAATIQSTSNPIDGIEALKQNTKQLSSRATPRLPSNSFRPKQSLGQNFLRDGNTVQKIVRTYIHDATTSQTSADADADADAGADAGAVQAVRAVELGPGAGALTDTLIDAVGINNLCCIEIDQRSIELLQERHPSLDIRHMDVLQVNYAALSKELNGPLCIVGNLPYYITSQILFALADASHCGVGDDDDDAVVQTATVTMQWEVAKRIVAKPRCKDYGILSVVFQLYANCTLHFKIPPTVFYPQPKVDSALVGLHFIKPKELQKRFLYGTVQPIHLRQILIASFQQRRKTLRKSLKKLVLDLYNGNEEKCTTLFSNTPPPPSPLSTNKDDNDNEASLFILPSNWASLRPEELTCYQFVALTQYIFGPSENNSWTEDNNGRMKKVWRKLKHGN